MSRYPACIFSKMHITHKYIEDSDDMDDTAFFLAEAARRKKIAEANNDRSKPVVTNALVDPAVVDLAEKENTSKRNGSSSNTTDDDEKRVFKRIKASVPVMMKQRESFDTSDEDDADSRPVKMVRKIAASSSEEDEEEIVVRRPHVVRKIDSSSE